MIIENLFTTKPSVTSGNGNLGLLAILLFSPIFVTSYILTFKIVKSTFCSVISRNTMVIILFFSFLSLVVLAVLIINYAKNLIVALGGPPTNPESRIYRFGWFNQYTNSMFFNTYTFLFTHILVLFVGILSTIKAENKNKQDGSA